METTNDSDWPLPSQSRKVRSLLYLTEGMIIGAGISIVLLFITQLAVVLYAVGFRTVVSVGGVFLLLLLLFLLVRSGALIKWASNTSSDSRYPHQYRNWQEIRQWEMIGVVAIVSSGILLGFSVILWGWVSALFSWALVLMSGAVILGSILYAYFFYKMGFNVFLPNTWD